MQQSLWLPRIERVLLAIAGILAGWALTILTPVKSAHSGSALGGLLALAVLTGLAKSGSP
jgi:hypothetical protein